MKRLLVVIFFCITLQLISKPKTVCFIYADAEHLFEKTEWVNRPFFDLKEHFAKKNISVIARPKFTKKTSRENLVVFLNIPSPVTLKALKKFPKKNLAVMILEPPTVAPENYRQVSINPFGHVLTFCPEHFKSDPNKLILSYPYYPFFKFYNKQKPFSHRKLLTLMAANKNPHPRCNKKNELYSLRRSAIDYFSKYERQFDLFGRWWPKTLSSYKGSVENKFETLINYKFSICFENTTNISGYVTEKLFDSFRAKCVPVYLGASNVSSLVPKNCYINFRDFKSFEDLHQYLKTMPEHVYNQYISDIDKFFKSEQIQPFSTNRFIEIFENLLEKM